MHLHYSLQKFVVHRYLIVDEEGVFDEAFFVGDGFVILEKFQVLFFPDFDIFYYGVQVLVQMLFDQFWVPKV